MAWTLREAKRRGDVVTIVYGEDYTDEKGKPAVRTHTVKHERTSFGGVPQTNAAWLANVKNEVVADLSDLNAAAAVETDVLEQVK